MESIDLAVVQFSDPFGVNVGGAGDGVLPECIGGIGDGVLLACLGGAGEAILG